MALTLAAVGEASGETLRGKQVPLVPPSRIIDATHLHRRGADEIEVIVLSTTAAGGLLKFHLDRRPVANIRHREAIRLYVSPGEHRFGVIPTSHVVLRSMAEIKANVTRDTPQIYRIFQSAGFTSSGGNAVFDIALVSKSGGRSQ